MPNTDSSQAAFTQRKRGQALGIFHAANPDNNRNGPQSTIPGSVYNVIRVGNASNVGAVAPPVVITIPDAPTIGTATPGNTQASVTFTAPVNDGGSDITSYTVTSSPGGFTASGPSSPLIVTGLTNGTAYTFTVTATNSMGPSAPSSVSSPVTPATVPDAPTIGTATPGNAQASVTFTAPANNGGSDITSYTVTSSPDGVTATGTASPIVVTGLTNGTPYTFTVTATNSAGPSAPSSASTTVTPELVAPDPPTSLVATPAGTSVSIAFTPGNDNGSAITNYQYSINNGSFTAFSPVDARSPVTISGLFTNTPYDIQLKAVNAAGPSIASATVTTRTLTLASAPTITSIGRGVKTLTVNFNAPSNTGGSPIINYKYSTNNGVSYALMNPLDIDSPLTITTLSTDGTTLLANGAPYTIRIRAVTAAGDGTVSSPVSGTTLGVPSAPAITYAIPGNTQVSVYFSAPSNDGGSTITSYTVASSPGGFTASGASSPIAVTGLTNGTAYTFTVTATNSVGPSPLSSTYGPVTPDTTTRSPLFSGSGTWTVPAGVTSVNYLVVGGGGGGGGGVTTGGGGGGGGGSVKTGTLTIPAGTTSLSYTVGAGGAKGIVTPNSPTAIPTDATDGTAGGDSIFATITAKGGGGGYRNFATNSSGAYGRGGSAQAGDTPTTGGSGGRYRDGDTNFPASGAGGGGGGAGDDAHTPALTLPRTNNNRGGTGGSGAVSNLLEGIARTYGAGGNGADEGTYSFIGWSYPAVPAFGNGAVNGKVGADGAATTGNGGGGGASTQDSRSGSDGGNGGSGIIVLTY